MRTSNGLAQELGVIIMTHKVAMSICLRCQPPLQGCSDTVGDADFIVADAAAVPSLFHHKSLWAPLGLTIRKAVQCNNVMLPLLLPNLYGH